MAAFVKMTQSTGDVVFINPEHVARFREAAPGQTLILFAKDDTVTVRERIQDVAAMLQGLAAARELAPA